MNEIFVDKLIITQCVIFGIMTSIIISNKWHNANSFFERVVGVILGSIGFIYTYAITIHFVIKYLNFSFIGS